MTPTLWHPPKKLKTCIVCDNSFLPRIGKQRVCDPCHKPCKLCGAKKDWRAVVCGECKSQYQQGVPRPKNRKQPLLIDEIIKRSETLGLLPEKQFAFGYVIGTIFGDGSVSKSNQPTKHKCTNGNVTIHPATTYQVRLSVISKEFADAFARQWNKLTDRAVKTYQTTRSNFSKSTIKGQALHYQLTLYNFTSSHLFLGRYLAYLKYECEPSRILRFPQETLLGFVCGMIDSEGYVSDKYLDVANREIQLLECVSGAFQKLGFRPTLYQSPSHPNGSKRSWREGIRTRMTNTRGYFRPAN